MNHRNPVRNKHEVVPIAVHSPIDPSQILTLAELAARLKVSERWVYEKSRRRCLNPLPVIRIGRYLRFDWLEVSAWLRQQTGRAA
jgi:predicted DNA-binding transcriptional regulator AlpA